MNKKKNLYKLFKYYLNFFFNKKENMQLKEIVKIYKGKQLNKSLMNNSYNYKVYNGSNSHIGYWKEFNEKANTIIINEGGTAGNVYYIEEDFWASGHSYIVKFIDENNELNYKYLFYILKCKEEKIKNMQKGSTIKNISKDDILNMKINFSPSDYSYKQVLILDSICDILKYTEEKIEFLEKMKRYYLSRIFS